MDFRRIERFPPYVFSIVNDLKMQARRSGEDIIDLGMGNPDIPTPEAVVEKLKEAVVNPRNHRYSASKGIPKLRRAICDLYERAWDVTLDPDTEAIATIGAKEGLAHLAWVLLEPGDSVLVPEPTYPIHTYAMILAGANVTTVPLSLESDFFADLVAAYERSEPKPRVVLCSMPGWRLAFAVGNPQMIGALTKLKSYLDYGVFQPIQIAGIIALNECTEVPKQIREIYRNRRDTLCDGLDRIGWEMVRPPATMFAWAQIPEAYQHMGSLEFAKMLVRDAKVAVSPGIGFGPAGDEYVRFALVENEQRIRQAIRGIRKAF